MIAFPPLESGKGVALLSQNRQFQWFNNPTFIYPVIPAYAATMLKQNGFEVIWNDGIAGQKKYCDWLDETAKEKPGLIAIESKTPVIKMHWRIIADLKERLPNVKIALMGDHVTALPKESMQKSRVDFVLTGGDFDFLLLNLALHLRNGKRLEKGIWFRKGKKIESTGCFELSHSLDSLPLIDRELSKWKLYAFRNGNFKKTPGTYIMTGRDCWYAKCSFCSWTALFPKFRSRSPRNVVDEIGFLIGNYAIKEIMDDSGTFPVGKWLEEFCNLMIEKGYNKRVAIDCNMRVNAVSAAQYKLMKKAGFRFILYGLESANQKTLDRINKGIKAEQIEQGAMLAKQAGLEPHLTAMIGYPWESLEDAERTIALAKRIFEKGFADSLQATIVIPYPGTRLFKECKKNAWLLTEDWERFDMREPVMRTPMSKEQVVMLTNELYKVFFTPKYLLRKILGIRGFSDLAFFSRGAKALLGHLKDFSGGE
jgi:radical SAM superfamily enzyme YgiQ (UPF0313 family)